MNAQGNFWMLTQLVVEFFDIKFETSFRFFFLRCKHNYLMRRNIPKLGLDEEDVEYLSFLKSDHHAIVSNSTKQM